jgi:hypothetical protein
MLAGDKIPGGVLSRTVTVNEQMVWLPPESRAVDVTTVVPVGNAVPEGGSLTTLTGQLPSVAVTVKVTTAEQVAKVLFTVMLGGQLIVGGVGSTTVTVN